MSHSTPMTGPDTRGAPALHRWILGQLDQVKDQPRVVLRDPLRLLSDGEGAVHVFARSHGFTVIMASTNLVFRELYEHALGTTGIDKLLVIDRSTARGVPQGIGRKAPPPFYPDLLQSVPDEARLDLDLRRFLVEWTDDVLWPMAVQERRFARLVVQHLDGVLRAHQNLRAISKSRFTDADLGIIIAHAALGIPSSAFKRLDDEDYWKIGLIGYEALEEIEELAPEVGGVIRDQLRKAPAPFCWLADEEAGRVVRAFYLAVIFSQHTSDWALLLNHFEAGLTAWGQLSADELAQSALKLVHLDPAQADRDLQGVEESLSADELHYLLLERFGVSQPNRMVEYIEKERYSALGRGLCVLLALDNLLGGAPAKQVHDRVRAVLQPEAEGAGERASTQPEGLGFIDERQSQAYANTVRAYLLATDCLALKATLSATVKRLRATSSSSLEFVSFWSAWNESRLNRLEYQFSQLERLADTVVLLPRPEEELPAAFVAALRRVRERVRVLVREVESELDQANRAFQELVRLQYPVWVRNDRKQDNVPVLTAQFMRFCLKHQWDPAKEKAVLLVFDGMRYDMWDELLRPLLLERMEVVEDVPAISLLPSETHVTRKAISAGTFPDQFDMGAGEDRLLAQGLLHAIDYKGPVDVVAPEGAGTGEVVRYRAGNLDVCIFELCDQALHHNEMKRLSDGREVPSRPLEYIYQQLVKNVLETEVAAILRPLSPGTKVFVTADHGFGRVDRGRLQVDESLLSDVQDCHYRNAWLKVGLEDAGAPAKLREGVVEFATKDLRMPAVVGAFDRRTGTDVRKPVASIIFPKVGYALARPRAAFNPDAFSHGGISLQELIVPMIVLRVKARGEGLVRLGDIAGPAELVEGTTAEYHLRVERSDSSEEDLRLEVEANYGEGTELPRQVHFVPRGGANVTLQVRPRSEEANEDERRVGVMDRVLTVTVGYRENRRILRKTQTKKVTIQLSSERIIRRVGNLGTILGLAPKDAGR